MKNIIYGIVGCFVLVLAGYLVYCYGFAKDSTEETPVVETVDTNSIDFFKGEDGVLVSIVANTECVPVKLVLYDDNSYKLYTELCREDEACDGLYRTNITSTYEFDVPSLFDLASVQKLDDGNKNADWKAYTLTTGKGVEYISNSNNVQLNNLLEQLQLDLNTCADIQQ